MSNHFQTSSKRAVETTDVTKSFGWDSSEGTKKPHDFKIHVLSVVYIEIKVLGLKTDVYSQTTGLPQSGQPRSEGKSGNSLPQGLQKSYLVGKGSVIFKKW